MIYKKDEVELIEIFLEQGYTHAEIANELGRTSGNTETFRYTGFGE